MENLNNKSNKGKKLVEKALLSCVVSSETYVFARAIDYVTMLVFPAVTLIVLIEVIESPIIIVVLAFLAIYIMEIIRLFTKGIGFGFLLWNIRFVDEMTCKPITGKDYWEYIISKISLSFYHKSLFTSWHVTESRKTQTKAMEENCILAVNKKKYKKFLKHYMDENGNIKQSNLD